MKAGFATRLGFVLLMMGLVGSGASTRANTPFGLPTVCLAKGSLIVDAANQVRFSAEGTCGAFDVSVEDTQGGPCCPLPTWDGGCGYGPGPFPAILASVIYTDPVTGAPLGDVLTKWHFPELVPGPLHSVSRIRINEAYFDRGGVVFEGGVVGHGVLLTRIFGGCDVASPQKAGAVVAFEIQGDPLS